MEPKTIPSASPTVKSMNYQALLTEGLKEIIRYSGNIWTDYNESDPGITILELLCYVLTDLGYRTNYPIEDILTTKPHEAIKPGENAFYPPSAIFPTNPFTPNDYRKLLLSNCHELQNVWVKPIRSTKRKKQIKGLYNIFLQIIPDHKDEEVDIVHKVKDLLNQHRNLCEDYETIEVVKDKDVFAKTKIIINPGSDSDEVKAKVLWTLNNFFSPYIPRWTREELQKEGQLLSEIYDGPKQEYGFIKTEDLKPFKEEIQFSDLIELLTQLEEVERVEDLTLAFSVQELDFAETFLKTDQHILEIPLTKAAMDQIILMEKNIAAPTNLDMVTYFYQKVREEQARNYCIIPSGQVEEIPQGAFQNIPQYYSLQRELPTIYQVGENKALKNASPLRKAQTKQLKAYLLFFEQYLANYLSQLAHTKSLFSLKKEVDQTYFGQVPKNVPRLREVVVPKFANRLQQLLKKYDPFPKRRNLFVEHLLARFAETLPAPALTQLGITERATLNEQGKFNLRKIDLGLDFLQRYENLSTNRGRAFDYLKSTNAKPQTSGLRQRLELFLQDPKFSFYLIENILLRPSRKSKIAGFWIGNKKNGEEEILLRNRFYTNKKTRNERYDALKNLVRNPNNFKIKKSSLPYNDHPWRIVLTQKDKLNKKTVEIAQYPQTFSTKEAAQAILPNLRKVLRNQWSGLNLQKTDLLDTGFFSNRLTIILFRASEENKSGKIFKALVRQNTPAHLGVNYISITEKQASSFLAYYNAWQLSLTGKKTYINPMDFDELASLLINFLLNHQ